MFCSQLARGASWLSAAVGTSTFIHRRTIQFLRKHGKSFWSSTTVGKLFAICGPDAGSRQQEEFPNEARRFTNPRSKIRHFEEQQRLWQFAAESNLMPTLRFGGFGWMGLVLVAIDFVYLTLPLQDAED
jgi:hypothetical protein